MRGKVSTSLVATAALLFQSSPAFAWGDEGHEIVGYIAYALLTPNAKATVDALLAADTDQLTAPDFASRATWADKYRDAGGRHLHYLETRNWHFVDTEISAPDLNSACFSFPSLAAGQPASQGPAQDCAVNKVSEFAAELADDNTPEPERIVALKFLMHIVGDIHQPLHSSDDNDAGGNCEQVRLTPRGKKIALHHFWDTEAVEAVISADEAEHPGETLSEVADHLRQAIAPSDLANWQSTDPKAWAQESFSVAKATAYNLPPHAACGGMKPSDYPAFVLPDPYQTQAAATVQNQLEKAGVRLATVINQALS